MGLIPLVTPKILAAPVDIFEDLGDFDPLFGARRFKVKTPILACMLDQLGVQNYVLNVAQTFHTTNI